MVDGVSDRIAVGAAALVAPENLERCLVHVSMQRDLAGMADAAVVMNGPAVAPVCDKWEGVNGVAVHRPGRNLGTSAAWNRLCRWAWKRGARGMLILGDDMALTDPGTLGLFLELYAEGGWRQMRFVMGRGFSAVCVTRDVWDEVGGFDEGFWPAYYEDNDYWRRFTVRGIGWDHVVVDSVHEGSATLSRSDEIKAINGYTFTLNGDRYRAKWGGGPHQEAFEIPWNGGTPTAGTREMVPEDVRARVEAAYGPADDSW